MDMKKFGNCTPRETLLIQMALSYLSANLDDAIEAFEDENRYGHVSIAGHLVESPASSEVDYLLRRLFDE